MPSGRRSWHTAADILIANAARRRDAIEDVTWRSGATKACLHRLLLGARAFRAMEAQGRGGQIVFIVSKNGLRPGAKPPPTAPPKPPNCTWRVVSPRRDPVGYASNSLPDAVIEVLI
jgi:hypothetical protein